MKNSLIPAVVFTILFAGGAILPSTKINAQESATFVDGYSYPWETPQIEELKDYVEVPPSTDPQTSNFPYELICSSLGREIPYLTLMKSNFKWFLEDKYFINDEEGNAAYFNGIGEGFRSAKVIAKGVKREPVLQYGSKEFYTKMGFDYATFRNPVNFLNDYYPSQFIGAPSAGSFMTSSFASIPCELTFDFVLANPERKPIYSYRKLEPDPVTREWIIKDASPEFYPISTIKVTGAYVLRPKAAHYQDPTARLKNERDEIKNARDLLALELNQLKSERDTLIAERENERRNDRDLGRRFTSLRKRMRELFGKPFKFRNS
jgi:hypothetical protein